MKWWLVLLLLLCVSMGEKRDPGSRSRRRRRSRRSRWERIDGRRESLLMSRRRR